MSMAAWWYGSISLTKSTSALPDCPADLMAASICSMLPINADQSGSTATGVAWCALGLYRPACIASAQKKIERTANCHLILISPSLNNSRNLVIACDGGRGSILSSLSVEHKFPAVFGSYFLLHVLFL
jgi:hypothetical protein